jgi:hypothetical protein
MLLGASGSFFTYEFRGRKITRFGNGLLSISADKSTNLSGSTDVLSVIADVVKDIDYDCSNRYNEIPGRTFLSESRHVPWIGGGKQYNYKFSPQCSLPFRRMDRDPRGYSRKVRNSPMDYSDEIYSSRSFSQIPNNNQYYYGSGQDAYDQNGRLVRIHRNKPINKFFGGEVGNPPDDLFISYGSGSVSSSNESYLDNKIVKNKAYYQNNKGEFPYVYSPTMRAFDSVYGSAQDSLNYSLIFGSSLDVISGLIINENFGSGSDTNAYIEQYRLASGSLSHSYGVGDTILREKGTEAKATFYCSGKSGSLDLHFNNKDFGIPNETIISNAAVLKSYVSSKALYTASAGTGSVSLCQCPGIPAKYEVYQMTSSFIINSCDCLSSAVSVISYYDYLFSIKHPTIDVSYSSSHESFSSTKGFTVGIFLSYYTQNPMPITYLYMLPICNFSIDSSVRVLSVDKNYTPMFTNTGKTWANDILYKLSFLIDLSNRKFVEIMLDGEFLYKIDLSTIIGAIVHYLNPNLGQPQLVNDSILTTAWAFAGSIDTAIYDEYNIFTIRCAKNWFYVGKLYNYFQDISRFKLVNRYLKSNIYHGQLRKTHAGSLNTGIRLLNFNNDLNDVAVAVSCSLGSVSDLRYRPCIYPIDFWNKQFQNNHNKIWHAGDYFPKTAGF